MMIQKLIAHLREQREAMTDFVEALAREETPSRVGSSQWPLLDKLNRRLATLHFYTLQIRGRRTGGYLYARPNSRKPHQPFQLLIGHCDTVWDIGTLEAMPLERSEDQLKGPGVFDMKAGLAQIIFALEALQALDLHPVVCPVVLINSDEEIGSRESTHAIARLARLADRAFVLEPPLGPEGKIKTARKGLGRFTLTVKGKAAHAGLDPEQGVSAILELSHQVQRLFSLNDPKQGITVNVGMIEGGISPNVVAPEGRAVIDVRVLHQEDAQRISHAIHALRPVFPGTQLLVEGAFGRPPMEQTPRNRLLWLLARQAGQSMGLRLEEATAGGGSDGNTTSLYTATLDGLGIPGGGAHAAHEFIFLDRLVERTALLALLLMADPVKGQEISPITRTAHEK